VVPLVGKTVIAAGSIVKELERMVKMGMAVRVGKKFVDWVRPAR
jgi:hypothetical protein